MQKPMFFRVRESLKEVEKRHTLKIGNPQKNKNGCLEKSGSLSRQKRTTSHLSKQLCNHPATPLVLHNTQWIFITSPTCFLPSSLALLGQLHHREQSNNTFYFFPSKSQRMKKDVDMNVTGVL